MNFDFKFILRRTSKIHCWDLWGLIGIIFSIAACQTSRINPSVDTESNQEITSSVQEEEIEENIGIQKVTRNSVQRQAVQHTTPQGVVLPEVNPLELDGSIRIAGSTIVFSISKAITERFLEEGYSQPIDIASISTKKAFELFCQNKLDIVNAYRPITNAEFSTCQQVGQKPVYFQIGIDSLAVVNSTQNEFLPKDLTRDEIKQIFTAKLWSDVNAEWSDTEIAPTLYELTTLDTQQIITTIFDGDREELINAPNLQFIEDEEELIANALTNPDLISITSYGDYYKNQDTFKVISIDGIEPNKVNQYPLVRPLYIYADVQDIQNRPEIAAFINYYLTHVNEEIEHLGYFPVSQSILEDSKARLLQLID